MKLSLIILLVFLSSQAQTQKPAVISQDLRSNAIPSVRSDPQRLKVLDLFKKIEINIQSGTVDYFERDLAPMVSIAMSSGEGGYLSANQAASMLASYFSGRRPISFQFSRISEKGSLPYATGRFVYIQKGKQESTQVYVSLIRQESKWFIRQFNIY